MVYDNLVGLTRQTKKMMKRINCHKKMFKVVNLGQPKSAIPRQTEMLAQIWAEMQDIQQSNTRFDMMLFNIKIFMVFI